MLVILVLFEMFERLTMIWYSATSPSLLLTLDITRNSYNLVLFMMVTILGWATDNSFC